MLIWLSNFCFFNISSWLIPLEPLVSVNCSLSLSFYTFFVLTFIQFYFLSLIQFNNVMLEKDNGFVRKVAQDENTKKANTPNRHWWPEQLLFLGASATNSSTTVAKQSYYAVPNLLSAGEYLFLLLIISLNLAPIFFQLQRVTLNYLQ